MKRWQTLVCVCVLMLATALFLGGAPFIRHFAEAVPSASVHGNATFMQDGDHLQQLYRYSLVRHNLLRSNWPYANHYQFYESDTAPAHDESLVFFPFSTLSAIIAALSSDVVAFNLMILLSFVVAGLGAYSLAISVTQARATAVVIALWFACLPMRTSFAFHELVFAIEVGLLPLALTLFERAVTRGDRHAFGCFGIVLLLLSMANFGLLYWFILFGSPYFAVRIWMERGTCLASVAPLWALPGLVCAVINLAVLRQLLNHSTLAGGQPYAEVMHYAPSIGHLFTRYSGNDHTLYLGGLFFLVLVMAIWGRAQTLVAQSPRRGMVLATSAVATLSLLMSFGPNLRELVTYDVYRIVFDHVPGAAGTRTTGRFTLITATFLIPLFSVVVRGLEGAFAAPLARAAVVALLCVGTLWDSKYGDASMSVIERRNLAYEQIGGKQAPILGLPLDSGVGHRNAEFAYQGLIHDLRFVNGYGSFHSKSWGELFRVLQPLNAGQMSAAIASELLARGVGHISIHLQPRPTHLPLDIVSRLASSGYLTYVADSEGVLLFSIRPSPAPVDAATEAALLRLVGKRPVGRMDRLPVAERLALVRAPERILASVGMISIPVQVKNASNVPWRSGEPYPVRLAYYMIRDSDGKLVAEGLRTDLDGQLDSGQTQELVARLDRPAPGAYTVYIDMIQDGADVFSPQANHRRVKVIVQ